MRLCMNFFTESRFSVDLERASVLYHGIFGNAINESAKSRQEAFNSFWDYFLLDYRLMLRDMHPLEYFMKLYAAVTAVITMQALPSATAIF